MLLGPFTLDSHADHRRMIETNLLGAMKLTDHISHPAAKKAAEQMYEQLAVTAKDIAEVIAFAVTRPRRMTLN